MACAVGEAQRRNGEYHERIPNAPRSKDFACIEEILLHGAQAEKANLMIELETNVALYRPFAAYRFPRSAAAHVNDDPRYIPPIERGNPFQLEKRVRPIVAVFVLFHQIRFDSRVIEGETRR